jgi:hypothetical protein
MRIELNGTGGLRLRRGQTLRVVNGAGTRICAQDGAVWLTEQNSPADVVLEPGNCYRLARRGVAVIEALGDASLSFA